MRRRARRRACPLLILAAAAFTLSCGRTGLFNDGVPPTGDAIAPDAGDAPEAPLFVFTGSACPSSGIEADLVPEPLEELAVVRFRAVQECSGAGGDWLVGRVDTSSRHLLLGGHACFFLPPELREADTVRFGVVRFQISAGLLHAPHEWCVADEKGREISSDARSIAWGVYSSEAAADAAFTRLSAMRGSR